MADPFPRKGRDLRLDFFRGLSLFFIFIDHIPNNFLGYFTLRSFAFCDAAEVFIFISGYTAALVYGNSLRQHGTLFATAQVYRRVWQLYVAHIFLFVIFTAEVSYAVLTVNNPMYTEEMRVGDFLEQPHVAIIQALLLQFQPAYLDILPLYIVLLAVFPLVLLALERGPLWALLPSAALYSLTLRHGWGMPAYPAENFWFFNPMAWQFLFVIGASAGHARVSGRWPFPHGAWLAQLAVALTAPSTIAPKKARRLARKSAILHKIQNNDIRVVNDIVLTEAKTKHMADEYINPAGKDVTEAFKTYARPLVGELPAMGRIAISPIDFSRY
jgi:hypothetical protein